MLSVEQRMNELCNQLDESAKAKAAAERERDNQADLRRALQARFSQQRTLDGQVMLCVEGYFACMDVCTQLERHYLFLILPMIFVGSSIILVIVLYIMQVVPGIRTLSEVYAALGLRLQADGTDITGCNTSFVKELNQLTDRRVRTLVEKSWLPIKVVLDAVHHDTVGVLRLLLGRAETESSTAVQKELLTSALADLPIVKDVVNELNHTTDVAEERRLLSFLTQSFKHSELNDNLGLEKTISRRRHASHHVISIVIFWRCYTFGLIFVLCLYSFTGFWMLKLML